jgi:hypothetical protein
MTTHLQTSNAHICIIQTSTSTIITIDSNLLEQFKDLINRSLNCFPDAHPELKEFGDLITEGKVLQDYSSQR